MYERPQRVLPLISVPSPENTVEAAAQGGVVIGGRLLESARCVDSRWHTAHELGNRPGRRNSLGDDRLEAGASRPQDGRVQQVGTHSPTEVAGITGYLDTNYRGKAEGALAALERLDLVYVHVEAPDEAGHSGDAAAKCQALEDFDAQVVGPILDGLAGLGPCRILMTPDHRTPIALRTPAREPVPFVLWGEGIAADGLRAYDETAAGGELQVERGHELIDRLVGKD